jgi:hypothetical protein
MFNLALTSNSLDLIYEECQHRTIEYVVWKVTSTPIKVLVLI